MKSYRYVGIMKILNLHPGNVQLVRQQFRGVKIMLLSRNYYIKLKFINDLGVVEQ